MKVEKPSCHYRAGGFAAVGGEGGEGCRRGRGGKGAGEGEVCGRGGGVREGVSPSHRVARVTGAVPTPVSCEGCRTRYIAPPPHIYIYKLAPIISLIS